MLVGPFVRLRFCLNNLTYARVRGYYGILLGALTGGTPSGFEPAGFAPTASASWAISFCVCETTIEQELRAKPIKLRNMAGNGEEQANRSQKTIRFVSISLRRTQAGVRVATADGE